MKVILGAGKTILDGWNSTQEDELNLLNRSDFEKKAKDGLYRYVESNIYNDRKQSLPVVTNIEIVNTEQKEFKYKESSDDNAYYITMKWDYTDEAFSDYQKEATLVFIHEDEKLYLVELQK